MNQLDLSSIVKYPFPENQYIKEDTQKTQIYLHHTAGNPNGVGVFDYWKGTSEKIATCVTISGKSKNGSWKDGQIIQGFSSKYWAYHLGLKSSTFKNAGVPFRWLDKTSIGIEICNWGQLTKTARGWETYVGTLVPEDEIIELPTRFKGFKFFHNYTDAQIESVRQLLVYWNGIWEIPIEYKGDQIFNLDIRALSGESGVYTHNSVRRDKVDIYPHPKMIQMLKSL
jgi:hypothetical protein